MRRSRSRSPSRASAPFSSSDWRASRPASPYLGVYSVVSFSVAQRTKEIGLRMALGARGRAGMADVVRSGVRLASIGVGIGLVVALSAADVLRDFLVEPAPTDPTTYVAVALAVLGVSAAARYL